LTFRLDLKFVPLVTLDQRCVSTKVEVSISRKSQARDRRTDRDRLTEGQTVGRGATLNVAD